MQRALAVTALWLAATRVAGAAELAVPGDFATIQAAIDAAVSGDTIVVAPGAYTENLRMRSGVTVRGRETARTLLGPDSAGPTVLMDGVSDATLANLTLVDSTIGVRITNGTDLVVTNVVFDAATEAALDIDAFSVVEIAHNVFFENSTAIRRLAGEPRIVNNLFAGNVTTIVSPVGLIGANVEFNGFFDNDDLRQGDVDTGLGTDFQIGNPRFVDTTARDFHVRAGSIAIDAGTGIDVIDDTVADLGAYGGPDADARPFPVAGVALVNDSASSAPPYALAVSWDANLDYRIADTGSSGGYRVYYRQNGGGPPYDGDDAAGGTEPSPVEVGAVTRYVLANLAPAVDAPAPTRLLSASGRNESVALSWEAVSAATGYRIHYGVSSPSENVVDVAAATSATVAGLANGTEYRFAVAATRRPVYHVAVTAVDGTAAANESAFSEEQQLALGPVAASVLSNELTATPEVSVPVPDLPDKGCFVATAAYGAAWQPAVAILRDFRDRYLLHSDLGRRFVAWYYAHGPAGAQWLDDHDEFKPLVRGLLTPVVIAALVLLGSHAWQQALLVSLIFVLTIRWRRRFGSRKTPR